MSSRATACLRSSDLGGEWEYDAGAMVKCTGTYVLAVTRELRDSVPADWQARVRELGGLSADSSASQYRMQIEADTAALERIRQEFEGLLRIEPTMLRAPAD